MENKIMIIKPSVEYLPRTSETELLNIELAGRVCYKSEDNLSDTLEKQEKYVQALMKRGHYSVIEHSNLILEIPHSVSRELNTKYLNVTPMFRTINHVDYDIVSGSFRAWRHAFYDNSDFDYKDVSYLLAYLTLKYPIFFKDIHDQVYVEEVQEFHFFTSRYLIHTEQELKEIVPNDIVGVNILRRHICHTVRFITDRGVTHELVRHRNCGFSQESTRYVNYGKHGGQFIEPLWFQEASEENIEMTKNFLQSCYDVYVKLLEDKHTPQDARAVLPNNLKTEIIVTANEEEWKHILNLRYFGITGKPHPEIERVMKMLYPILAEKSDRRL